MQARTPLRPHREDSRHEPRQALSTRRNFKVFFRCFDWRDRSKWPEFLAELNFPVELIACFDRMWRGENAAMTKSARAELECAIHPSNNKTCREIAGNLINQQTIIELIHHVPILLRE